MVSDKVLDLEDWNVEGFVRWRKRKVPGATREEAMPRYKEALISGSKV
jgi:hypothetical protein